MLNVTEIQKEVHVTALKEKKNTWDQDQKRNRRDYDVPLVSRRDFFLSPPSHFPTPCHPPHPCTAPLGVE